MNFEFIEKKNKINRNRKKKTAIKEIANKY